MVPTVLLGNLAPHWIANLTTDWSAQRSLDGVRVAAALTPNIPTNKPMQRKWRAYFISRILEAPMQQPGLQPIQAAPNAQNNAVQPPNNGAGIPPQQ
ncbi:MAG: hypothetical protein GY847_18210 [Proteobacteria bacterium]|nr:hypothetical protein [Pseudomonadota bacterium]